MTYAFFTAPELSKVELSLCLAGNPPRKICSAMESSVGVYWTLPSDSLLNKFSGQLLGGSVPFEVLSLLMDLLFISYSKFLCSLLTTCQILSQKWLNLSGEQCDAYLGNVLL